MRKSFISIIIFLIFLFSSSILYGKGILTKVIKLPEPIHSGSISVEEAIKNRRTVRSFKNNPLTTTQISQILWSAQGITGEGGFKRAAPSAGALYPLDVYIVVGKDGVKSLEAGIYHYLPEKHSIELTVSGDYREKIAAASLRQMWIAEAPVIFIITADYQRCTRKYGERGVRYTHMEVGHVGQNIFLQSEALKLHAGIVGAFYDDELAKALQTPKNYLPMIIMPVGY